MRIAVTALFLVASAVVTAASITIFPFYDVKEGSSQRDIVLVTSALWLLFGMAYLLLRKVPVKSAIVLVIAGSVAIGGAAMAGPPNTSTDSARYAWDGIVQNAGISPYAYVPSDPALTALRPDWLFPAPVMGPDGTRVCEGSRIMTFAEANTGDVLCTAINRAGVPTIYPPTSEIFFAGVRFLTGPTPQYWPMQLAGLLLSLGTTVLLLRTLLARGLDPRWAALWGWSPLAATEAVTNSHIDVLGALLMLAASVFVSSGHHWRGGIALGAAIAVKLVPVIAAPALLRRQPWKIVLAAVATFVALYIPYVITTGIGVIGYLPGYLAEEGYSSGQRFLLVSMVAPGPAAIVVSAIILGLTGALVWWKTNPDDPWLGQLVMIGVALLVVAPGYPWYALLLLPFIAMTGRWEWLAVPLALTDRLLVNDDDQARVVTVLAVLLIVVVSLWRARSDALPRLGRWLRHPIGAKTETSGD